MNDGICWWCYWGWPKPIADIYNNCVKQLGDKTPLLYGPGHIVWADENFDCAQWCLDFFDKYPGELSDGELDVVRESLEHLLAVPDKFKHEPEGYDGENPADFPPPDDWEMMKSSDMSAF